MTKKEVKSHELHGALSVVQEMGLNQDISVRGPVSVIELSIASRNLVDMDVFSKSDPMCVMYVKEFGTEKWKESGRTEIIWNNLNPNFVKKFVMEYYFEEMQKLRFDIYDVDSKSPDLSKHDFLGRMECNLGEIVSSTRLQRPLKGPKSNSGSIILVSAEELTSCKEEVTMQWCGKKLDKKDLFGKSDPYLQFYRSNEDGSFTVVHKTEVIKNTLNPTWRPFTVPVRSLCNGDYDRLLKVECYDWDRDGGHDLIGIYSTSLRELVKGPGMHNNYECINPKKQAKKGKKYKHSGMVELMSCSVIQAHSFLDFIKGGCQVHCTIAVDFTASNGDPNQPTSLHYNNPYQPNLYVRALKSVGEIIQDYDSDKLFPALGFGARLPPDGRVSHEFFLSVGDIIQDYDSDKLFPAFGFGARLPPDGRVSHEFFLNGHPTNPYCEGVDGIVQAYTRTLGSVQLYGPTNFAPCINHVTKIASQNCDGNNYFILVILTDGVITDMPQTCEAIVNAASLPLSIIIIGIGDADFEAMNILDGDEVRLSSKGRFAARDIVQFVPFREFIGGKYGHDMARSQAQLAKEVLAEIPEQFLSYMKTKGFKPKAPLQRQDTLPTAPGATAAGYR